MVYTLRFFFSSKRSLFHNSNVFGSCIIHFLYISSTNIGTEYFKHGVYSPFFFLQNAVCFIILTYVVPVLFTCYIHGVLKLKNNSGAKRLRVQSVQELQTLTATFPARELALGLAVSDNRNSRALSFRASTWTGKRDRSANRGTSYVLGDRSVGFLFRAKAESLSFLQVTPARFQAQIPPL